MDGTDGAASAAHDGAAAVVTHSPGHSAAAAAAAALGAKRGRGERAASFCADCRPGVEALLGEVDGLRAEVDRLQAQVSAFHSPAMKPATGPAVPRLHRSASSVLPGGREVAIAPDELAAMHAIFALFDEDKDGRISIADLAALHKKMGEPITDEEARDAVSILSHGDDCVSFEDFAAYWDGTHPSLRRAADFGPEAISAERERKRQGYKAKFKFMKARVASPAIGRVFTKEVGSCPSLEYRLQFFYDAGAEGAVPISPWHDIPLRNADGTYNMIVEIPKWSRRKFEIATGEPFNPIKQDVKNGVLREYSYGDMLFNYGAFPQTWEDPKHVTPDTGAGGDNDPIDAVEVGTKMWATGSIVRVKILGVLGLIDSGETDWKVIVISAEDPLAPLVHDLADLDVHMPGAVEALHRWLKLYKQPVINEFAFGGAARDRAYATSIVEETHQLWLSLLETTVGEHGEGAAAGGGHGVSIKSAGLTRSSSKNALVSLLGHSSGSARLPAVSPAASSAGSGRATPAPAAETAPEAIAAAGGGSEGSVRVESDAADAPSF